MTVLPPVARGTDPSTSHIAARMISAKRPSQMLRLLMYYGDGSVLTDEQAAGRAGLLDTGYWKRCSDLRNLWLIEPTGGTSIGSCGSPQMLCKITDDGLDVLRKRYARVPW